MIHTAVFPVAGKGTRFLPATKSTPKEMFPIIDRPLIQYAIDEALAAGAKKLVFIISDSKLFIKNYVLDLLPKDIDCIFVNQDQPLGLGHAVLLSKEIVGDNPFYVHLVDDLIYSQEPCLKQMCSYFSKHDCSVIGVEKVQKEETSQYGIVDINDSTNNISNIIEKPSPDEAPSDLAVVGRYILTPRIFGILLNQGKGKDGEIQLTDAISSLLLEEPVHAFPFEGIRYDCGNKLGYLKANIEYGLRNTDLGDSFLDYLKSLRI